MRFWSNLCGGLIADHTVSVIRLCNILVGSFGADWFLIVIVGERNLPAIKSSCRHAVSHQLLKATLNRTSPFQNGGDLDHLSTVPPEQIHRIGTHMFCSALNYSRKFWFLGAALDDEFMCCFQSFKCNFLSPDTVFIFWWHLFIHVISFHVCSEGLLTPAWLAIYSRNPSNWLKLDLCKLERRSSFTPYEIWDRTLDMPRVWENLKNAPNADTVSPPDTSLSELGGFCVLCELRSLGGGVTCRCVRCSWH